jgi:hypothetical protein
MALACVAASTECLQIGNIIGPSFRPWHDVIDIKRDFLVRGATQFATATGPLQHLVAEASRHRLGIAACIRIAALRDEILDPALTSRDKFLAHRWGQVLEGRCHAINIPGFLQHSVPFETAPGHLVHHIPAVMLKLEDISTDKVGRDLLPIGLSTAFEHRNQHEWLVDVGHLHPTGIEDVILQFLEVFHHALRSDPPPVI